MSTLNGAQLLEIIGNVDDDVVAESLDFFCPGVAGGAFTVNPVRKSPRRALRALAAVGLVAALLGGVVTVTPLLGGPDLWRGFYGVIAPLLSPDETETVDGSSENATDEAEVTEKETRKSPTVIDPDDDFSGGIVQEPPTVPTPNIPSPPDPSPEWPTVNIPDPRPETPTVPRPSVPGLWP